MWTMEVDHRVGRHRRGHHPGHVHLGEAPELALLRLVRATRRRRCRMLRLETLIAVAIAVIIGTAIAPTTLSAFSHRVTRSARAVDPAARPTWR